jgi:hypothetical protein
MFDCMVATISCSVSVASIFWKLICSTSPSGEFVNFFCTANEPNYIGRTTLFLIGDCFKVNKTDGK